MSTKIAIGPASVQSDPFYRYQRDKLQVTAPNKAGVVTLSNINDIICQLETDKSQLLKFLGKELRTNITEKNTEIKMNGGFTCDQIEEKLQQYTEIHVLCPSDNCRKPELCKMDGNLQCKACGHHIKIAKDKRKDKLEKKKDRRDKKNKESQELQKSQGTEDTS